MSGDNIYIKLEIFRDKNSNDLKILTHFNFKSPNVLQNEEGLVWFPTIAENELINETFELFSEFKTNDKNYLNQVNILKKDKQILPENQSNDEKIIVNKVVIQKRAGV